LDIVDQLDQVDVQLYLRSDKAHEKNSLIRKVIESGIDSISNLENSQVAKLIFAAILLSGGTLYKLKDLIRD